MQQYQTIINDREVFTNFSDSARYIVQQQHQLVAEHHSTQEKYGESLMRFANFYLQELIRENPDYHICFTEQALEKIKTYEGELNQLQSILEKAFFFVKNLHPFQLELTIDGIHLNFEKEKIQVKHIEKIHISPQYMKTIQLLNRLENAAKNVLDKGLKLTSAHVGHACQPAITAPAISDAIKKHQHKILYLIDKYPERWELIRTSFKPIINIINKSAFKDLKSEIA